MAQADSEPNDVFSWVSQLENCDADKRIMGSANPYSSNGGNDVGTSEGGSE